MSKQIPKQQYVYTPKYKRDERGGNHYSGNGNPNQGHGYEHKTSERKDNMKYRTETIVMNDQEGALFGQYKTVKKSVIDSFENDYKNDIYGSLITTRRDYVNTYNASINYQKEHPILKPLTTEE